ncbi:MAG: helix-turn-helix transcriptional regulator, partial [Acidimicrobiales bacterium]
PWAEAAIAAARRRLTLAADLAEASAREAGDAGAIVPALWALTDVARYGAPKLAAAYLDELSAAGWHVDSPLVETRAAGIRARADGRPRALLEAAEAHAVIGLLGGALELAELAAEGRTNDASGARAGQLALKLRDRLGLAPTATAPAAALTRRELEVAHLAADGMTDREIADTLVISVRTVESHLAASYRKLGITSRRELRESLAPLP